MLSLVDPVSMGHLGTSPDPANSSDAASSAGSYEHYEQLGGTLEVGECIHYVVERPDPSNSPWVIASFCALYTNIFVLGLLGNLAIVFLTVRCRHLRSVQNIFILNLAISDVIVCLLSLPFTPVANIYKEWLFGAAICHLLPMVQAISIFVSTFSLSAIAIDRFWLVHYPHAGSLTTNQATAVAIVLWVLSVLISVPYALHMTLEEYPGLCGKFCTEQWPNKQLQRGYGLTVLILQFLIPFLTMSFCYASIFSRLRRRANTKLAKLNERQKMLAKSSAVLDSTSLDGPQPRSQSPPGELHRVPSSHSENARVSAVSKQQRRTTTILATVVLFFFFAWLPHNVKEIIMEYDEQLLQWGDTNYTYLLSMITHSVAMTTNVANPILYAWLNPTFKELFLRTANPGRRRRRRGPNGGSGRSNGGGGGSPVARCGDSAQTKMSRSTCKTTSLGDGQLLVQVNGLCRGGRPQKDFC